MTITDFKKIYDDVRISGKYVYIKSLFDDSIELYVLKDNHDTLYYVRDFDNMAECEKYISQKNKYA